VVDGKPPVQHAVGAHPEMCGHQVVSRPERREGALEVPRSRPPDLRHEGTRPGKLYEVVRCSGSSALLGLPLDDGAQDAWVFDIRIEPDRAERAFELAGFAAQLCKSTGSSFAECFAVRVESSRNVECRRRGQRAVVTRKGTLICRDM